jgi:hypothetical protein
MQTKSNMSAPSCPEALRLMTEALALLDEAEAPADIGAHLDLAICRLQEHADLVLAAQGKQTGLTARTGLDLSMGREVA